ncbi:MAG: DUF4349 domain-containing protein [Deltaproteobacteria bacterium]|nr:DUF4349 domain-containing protein [Deltaproteobacteria bacterium]
MRLTTSTSLLIGLAALGLGCASAAKTSMPPIDDRAYVEQGPSAMAAPAAMDDAPGAATITPTVQTASRYDAGTPAPQAASSANGVLATPARTGTTATTDGGTPAIADTDLPTTGDDAMDQMLVFNGALNLLVEPDTIPSSIDAAVDFAVVAGGYISQQTDTSLSLRVPSRRFRKVMKQIEGLGDVQSRSVQTMDVSEEFHDLKVRLANLEATRTRIQKLLGQAKTLAEILTVEKELERVGGEIDRIEGRLRFLSSQAAFSTVTIGFGEHARPQVVREEEPPPPPPPLPPRVLDSPVLWINDIDVHGLMNQPTLAS